MKTVALIFFGGLVGGVVAIVIALALYVADAALN